ncbi:MAG: iron-containing redox enzyme family protein [Ignavibacteria bacterium]|nr:iron-containing redox enzyme family protein [Ignavibacteria bacterium]
MKLKFRLLDHPFYQKWSKGEITEHQLADYAHSYYDFVSMMPNYWAKIIESLGVADKISLNVIKEEDEHVKLWEDFMRKYKCAIFTGMDDLNEAFSSMNPSELLGAIHAFEIQQPEVAKSKIEGLKKYYGFKEGETEYFDEHLDESEHINLGEKIANECSDRSDFERGFNRGSELVYFALDRFLN